MDNRHSDQATKLLAEFEWVWVLTKPRTKVEDSIITIEMEDKNDGSTRRIVPVFEDRESAAKLKFRLTEGRVREVSEQAMLLSEVGNFAAKNNAEIMFLDENGTILAHLEAKIEQVPLH